MHTIISSTGTSLRLTPDEYHDYKEEEHQLYLKYKKLEITRRGIYATNQNKYVKSVAELNSFDRKPTKEELDAQS